MCVCVCVCVYEYTYTTIFVDLYIQKFLIPKSPDSKMSNCRLENAQFRFHFQRFLIKQSFKINEQ